MQALLKNIFAENPALTSAGDLRDCATETREDQEELKTTLKQAREFLENKGRNHVFNEVRSKCPSRIFGKLKLSK